jgi:hypothetical protein
MQNPQSISAEVKVEFRSRRDKIASIKSETQKELSELMVKLLLERTTNVRSLMVLAGALASLSFLVLDKIESRIGTQLVAISDIGLLLVIVFSWLEMHRDLDKTLNKIDRTLNGNEALAEKSMAIYQNAIDDNITEEQLSQELAELEKEYNTNLDKESQKKTNKHYFYDLVTILFCVSILGPIILLTLLIFGV